MIWNRLTKLVLYPINWFWDRYVECKKKNQLLKAIGILIASLTGLVAIGVLVGLAFLTVVEWAMTNPAITCGIVLLIWLYMYVKNEREKKPENVTVEANSNAKDFTKEASEGYSSMRRIIYSAIRSISEDGSVVKPVFIEEIESPEEHFVTRDNCYFYLFRVAKNDVNVLHDAQSIKILTDKIQNKISAQIKSGAYPDIVISDYRDAYGNRYDGVVVDHINDMGEYYIIYTTYASEQYSEYKHDIKNQIPRISTRQNVDEEWSNL